MLGADIIAGFPTETEEMFARSLDLVEECGLTFLHVFPFSPRPGTPAARMPQVTATRSRSARRRLRAAGDAALQQPSGGASRRRAAGADREREQGRTEHFLPVAIAGEVPGAVLSLAITGTMARDFGRS